MCTCRTNHKDQQGILNDFIVDGIQCNMEYSIICYVIIPSVYQFLNIKFDKFKLNVCCQIQMKCCILLIYFQFIHFNAEVIIAPAPLLVNLLLYLHNYIII